MKFKKFAVGLTVLTVMNTSTPTIKVFANELENTNLKVEKSKTEVSTIEAINENSETISNESSTNVFQYFNNEEYSKEFKIQNSDIEYIKNNAGNWSDKIITNAIDGDIDTYWETNKNNNSSWNNEVEVEFKEIVTLDRIVYGARPQDSKGFAEEFEVYVSNTSSGDNYKLLTTGKHNKQKGLIEAKFEPTEFKRVKFKFKKSALNSATLNELCFYKEDVVSKEVDSVFEDNLYTVLSKDYDTVDEINALEEKVNKHPLKEELIDVIKLAKSIINGNAVEQSEVITLTQKGSPNEQKKRTGQMYAGSNFDVTGYYVMPGESVEVYVDADENGPMPSVVFSQVGEVNPYPDATSNNANAKPDYGYTLKPGRNVMIAPDKGTTKPYAIFFSNHALPENQKYAPKVRLQSDNLNKYPVYIDGKTDPNEYVEEVKNHTGANMTSLVGDRFLISTQNTQARLAYVDDKKSPLDFVREMKKLISMYDMISGLDENDPNPLHRPSNAQYHIKMTDGTGTFACNGYVHVSYKMARAILSGDFSWWGILHELGHQQESSQMRLGEVTNNLYAAAIKIMSGGGRNPEVAQKTVDDYLVTKEGEGYLSFGKSTRLIVPLQVTNYFGIQAYTDAFRLVRENPTRYNTGTGQSLITAMSEATGYDLSPHFEMFNFPLEEKTKEFTSQFKPLEKKLQYTTEKSYNMIMEKAKTFTDDTKAVIKDIKTEADGVTLNLGVSDEYEGITVYEIYRDGKLVGISRTNTFKDIVDSSELHDYEVVAYDYRVNESIKSDKVNAIEGCSPVINILDKNIQVDLNSKFDVKEYIKANDYKGNDISDKVVITHNVDTSKRGVYTVNCEVKDEGFTTKEEFKVEVVSKSEYASDIDWKSATSGWSKPVKDKAVGSSNKIKLNIDGKVKEFEKGLSAAANAEIVYDLEGKDYDYFRAYVGTDKNYDKTQTSLKFKVLADGKEVYSSELMKNDSDAEFIQIPLEGVKELTLVADDNGDGITGDFASWADAKFVSNNSNVNLEIEDDKISIPFKEEFDLMKGVKATDFEDGDLTSKIVIDENGFNINKPGEYQVKYTVTDSDNNTVTKTRNILVYSKTNYASDMDWRKATSGWRTAVKDMAVGSTNKIKLNIDGKIKEFDKGISAAANAEIVYDIDGKGYNYFTAHVGTDKNYNKTQTSLKFKVLADGKEVYSSELMKHDSDAEFIKIPLEGVKELKLIANDNGDGISGDFASWADARFITTNSKPELKIEDSLVTKVGQIIEDLVGKVDATDAEDGDISSKVVVDIPKDINYNKPGEYKVVYTITDSDNNTVTKERTIAIINEKDNKFLTDYDWSNAVQSYKTPQKDTNMVGETLKLTDENGREVAYERGIGVHATSEITYDLADKKAAYFTSYVGVDRVMYGRGSKVTFEVYVDGEKKFDSGAMTSKDPQKFVQVNIAGAKELKLVVTDGGNGNGQDHATWGDTKIYQINSDRADITKLQLAIEKAESIEREYYTEESLVNLDKVVNEAKKLLNLESVSQSKCEEAIKNIEEAIKNLELLNAEIKIKDKFLEDDIKSTLGIKDRELTIRDMEKLTSLTSDSGYVRSLEGLQYAKNLETLNVDYNEITDISPIGSLEKLDNFSGKENYRDIKNNVVHENGKFILEQVVIDADGEKLLPKEVVISPYKNPRKLNLSEVLVGDKIVIDENLITGSELINIVYESKTHDYQLHASTMLDSSNSGSVEKDNYDPTKIYLEGDVVIYKGEKYTAKWWVQGEEPDKSQAWEKEIKANEDGSINWTEGMVCNQGDVVVYNGKEYEAKWWTTSTPGSDDSWIILG